MKNQSFKEYLDNKNCFKLICGAGNQNYKEIERLCAIYSIAGIRFFDVNASIEAVRAAKNGIKFSGKEKECFICVSVGTKDDCHLSKYRINGEQCVKCGFCKEKCLEKAIIYKENRYYIDENKCIGCGRCLNGCVNNAIEAYFEDSSLEKILPEIIKEGVDCIEYHTDSCDEEEVLKGWKTITKLYKGALSVCVGRKKIGNETIITRLKKMRETSPSVFIVQADGEPMSGGKNDYRATLQAVAMADFIEKADITPYIFVSGGTNSKTKELINLFGINIAGIAIGSYARKIVKEYVEIPNFLQDKNMFEKAVCEIKKILKF